MRILLDTNIILDFFLSREPNYKASEKIFELICKEKIQAFTTANSITDIYYISVKKLGEVTTKDAIRNLFNLVSIIDVDGYDCINALDLPFSDFEDALIVVCANKRNI